MGHRQSRLQQELREAHDALAKELSVVDEKRNAADASIESSETRKLQLRQQLHAIDEKLHAAREGQRNWLSEKDRRRRAVSCCCLRGVIDLDVIPDVPVSIAKRA